jgi:hypothetical protein
LSNTEDAVPTIENRSICVLPDITIKLEQLDRMIETSRQHVVRPDEVIDRLERDIQSALQLCRQRVRDPTDDPSFYNVDHPRRSVNTFRWMQTPNFMLIGPNWEICHFSAEVPAVVKNFPWAQYGPPGTINAFGPELNRVH